MRNRCWESSGILYITIQKSDAILNLLCGRKVEQMNEVDQIQPFWMCMGVEGSEGVDRSMCIEARLRGKCDLEEPGFKFQERADVTAFGCLVYWRTPVVGLKSTGRVTFRHISQAANLILVWSSPSPRTQVTSWVGHRGTWQARQVDWTWQGTWAVWHSGAVTLSDFLSIICFILCGPSVVSSVDPWRQVLRRALCHPLEQVTK